MSKRNGKAKNGHDTATPDISRDDYILAHSPTILSGLLMRRSSSHVEDLIDEAIEAAGIIHDRIMHSVSRDHAYVLSHVPMVLCGMLIRRSGSSVDVLINEAINAVWVIHDTILENRPSMEGMFSQPIAP